MVSWTFNLPFRKQRQRAYPCTQDYRNRPKRIAFGSLTALPHACLSLVPPLSLLDLLFLKGVVFPNRSNSSKPTPQCTKDAQRTTTTTCLRYAFNLAIPPHSLRLILNTDLLSDVRLWTLLVVSHSCCRCRRV